VASLNVNGLSTVAQVLKSRPAVNLQPCAEALNALRDKHHELRQLAAHSLDQKPADDVDVMDVLLACFPSDGTHDSLAACSKKPNPTKKAIATLFATKFADVLKNLKQLDHFSTSHGNSANTSLMTICDGCSADDIKDFCSWAKTIMDEAYFWSYLPCSPAPPDENNTTDN
jgi:hypothetical protein